MEEQYFLHDGKSKRKAKKVVCKMCSEEWLIRIDRDHSGYCRTCKVQGENNPMFGKSAHNKGRQKFGAEYHVGVRRERKKKIILQMGNKCHKCNQENLPMSCYAIHHVDRQEKVFSVLGMLNHNSYEKLKDVIEQELKKCVLLCLNCHAIEHYGDSRAL